MVSFARERGEIDCEARSPLRIAGIRSGMGASGGPNFEQAGRFAASFTCEIPGRRWVSLARRLSSS
jgi:hypothetical protein